MLECRDAADITCEMIQRNCEKNGEHRCSPGFSCRSTPRFMPSRWWEFDFEGEPRSAPRYRLDHQLGTESGHQFAADREAKSRTGEMISLLHRSIPEWLEQMSQFLRRQPTPGVRH